MKIALINLVLLLAIVVRMKNLEKRGLITKTDNSTLFEKLKGFILIFLPVVNVLGMIVLCVGLFCPEEKFIEIFKS